MEFDRVEAKMAARESMRFNRPNPMLVTLVYLLLIAVVSGVVNWLTGSPVNEAVGYLEMGYDWDEIVEFVFLRNPGATAVFGGTSLLIGIYRTVMSFGYISYALRMARNEQPGYSHLFDGFALFLRVLWASILEGFFEFLWTLLYSIPAIVALVIILVVTGDAVSDLYFGVLMGVYWLFVLYFVAVSVIVSLRYRLTAYFLIDDPACTARKAIGRSKEAMKGNKWELFLLDLSFLPWDLLVGITAGILGVWVMPYQQGAYANFYDSVTVQTQGDEGGYTGQIYDRDSDSGPKPF